MLSWTVVLICSVTTIANAQYWNVTGSLTYARRFHTATLLPNGNVLVAGGSGSYFDNDLLNSAEVYNATTGVWTVTGSLAYARWYHTATLLPNGNVLVAGGWDNSGNPTNSAELYNTTTGLWTVTGNLTYARYYHTATLLPNGNVLVACGYDNVVPFVFNSAELYNSATGVWTVTSSLTYAREFHTATLLLNGNVLVAAGTGADGYTDLNSAELYNTTTGVWTVTGNLTYARFYHTATLLTNGNVLVAGGHDTTSFLKSAELYSATTGLWTVTASLTYTREYHTATLLPNGNVLVAGGQGNANLNNAELYNASTGVWTVTGSLTYGRYAHTATLLPNRNVLVACGYGATAIINSAELYNSPTVSTPTPTPTSTATATATPTPIQCIDFPTFSSANLAPSNAALLNSGLTLSGLPSALISSSTLVLTQSSSPTNSHAAAYITPGFAVANSKSFSTFFHASITQCHDLGGQCGEGFSLVFAPSPTFGPLPGTYLGVPAQSVAIRFATFTTKQAQIWVGTSTVATSPLSYTLTTGIPNIWVWVDYLYATNPYLNVYISTTSNSKPSSTSLSYQIDIYNSSPLAGLAQFYVGFVAIDGTTRETVEIISWVFQQGAVSPVAAIDTTSSNTNFSCAIVLPTPGPAFTPTPTPAATATATATAVIETIATPTPSATPTPLSVQIESLYTLFYNATPPTSASVTVALANTVLNQLMPVIVSSPSSDTQDLHNEKQLLNDIIANLTSLSLYNQTGQLDVSLLSNIFNTLALAMNPGNQSFSLVTTSSATVVTNLIQSQISAISSNPALVNDVISVLVYCQFIVSNQIAVRKRDSSTSDLLSLIQQLLSTTVNYIQQSAPCNSPPSTFTSSNLIIQTGKINLTENLLFQVDASGFVVTGETFGPYPDGSCVSYQYQVSLTNPYAWQTNSIWSIISSVQNFELVDANGTIIDISGLNSTSSIFLNFNVAAGGASAGTYCVFWDGNLQDWSTDGCTKTADSTSSNVHCFCDRLAQFGVGEKGGFVYNTVASSLTTAVNVTTAVGTVKDYFAYDSSTSRAFTGFFAETADSNYCCTQIGLIEDDVGVPSCNVLRCNSQPQPNDGFVYTTPAGESNSANLMCLTSCFTNAVSLSSAGLSVYSGVAAPSGAYAIPASTTVSSTTDSYLYLPSSVPSASYQVNMNSVLRRSSSQRLRDYSPSGLWACTTHGTYNSDVSSAYYNTCLVNVCNGQTVVYPSTGFFHGTNDCYTNCMSFS